MLTAEDVALLFSTRDSVNSLPYKFNLTLRSPRITKLDRVIGVSYYRNYIYWCSSVSNVYIILRRDINKSDFEVIVSAGRKS